jgi:phospholipase C
MVSLSYETDKGNRNRLTGNAFVRVRRPNGLTGADDVKLVLKDNSYGKKPNSFILKKEQEELEILLDLKNSHSWYDVTLTQDGNDAYAQQLAGHVEHHKSSFTDPLMGGLF